MTITQTVISRSVIGNKRMVIGNFTDDDSSGNAGAGGAVTTGLGSVEVLVPMNKATTVDASANTHLTIEGTYPTTSGNVTVNYDHAVTFVYIAIGR